MMTWDTSSTLCLISIHFINFKKIVCMYVDTSKSTQRLYDYYESSDIEIKVIIISTFIGICVA